MKNSPGVKRSYLNLFRVLKKLQILESDGDTNHCLKSPQKAGKEVSLTGNKRKNGYNLDYGTNI